MEKLAVESSVWDIFLKAGRHAIHHGSVERTVPKLFILCPERLKIPLLFFCFTCLRFKCKGRIPPLPPPLVFKNGTKGLLMFCFQRWSHVMSFFCPPQVRWNQDVVVNPKTRSTFFFLVFRLWLQCAAWCPHWMDEMLVLTRCIVMWFLCACLCGSVFRVIQAQRGWGRSTLRGIFLLDFNSFASKTSSCFHFFPLAIFYLHVDLVKRSLSVLLMDGDQHFRELLVWNAPL